MTLTPFYDRVKQAQGRTAVRRVIATSIKEYLPIVLRVLFTLFKERKDGHRISAPTARPLAAGPDPAASRRAAAGGRGAAGRPCGDPVERRHDRHAERRGRAAPALRRRRPAALRLDQVGQEAVDRRDHAAAAAVPRLRQRGRAAAGVRRPEPAVAGAEPARHRRRAGDDQAGEAGVLQRRADAVQRHPQPPRRCATARWTSARSSCASPAPRR